MYSFPTSCFCFLSSCIFTSALRSDDQKQTTKSTLQLFMDTKLLLVLIIHFPTSSSVPRHRATPDRSEIEDWSLKNAFVQLSDWDCLRMVNSSDNCPTNYKFAPGIDTIWVMQLLILCRLSLHSTPSPSEITCRSNEYTSILAEKANRRKLLSPAMWWCTLQ